MTRQEAVENLTLVLMYLTRFGDSEGRPFNELAWKTYDFDALNALEGKDLIYNPRTRRGYAKYAYLTEDGRVRAKELLSTLGIEDKPIYERFEFRCIKPDEVEEAATIEQICFPPNEACSHAHMLERAAAAPETFLVAIERATGKMAGFLNGIATDETTFRDEFFTDASLHKPDGQYVMILGLDVLPEYRKQGLGRELMFNYCRREQAKGRQMLVLTCLADKVKMYEKMGFRDRGISNSAWGGESWHEMDISLN